MRTVTPVHRSERSPRATRRSAVPVTYRRLIRAAEKARRRAYAPYSRFSVGAAVLTSRGGVYTGCNVENASGGLTQCAERVAVHCAVADGQRRLEAVAVVGAPGITPCGACRQVMSEFGVKTVILASPRAAPTVVTLQDLLPLPFTLRAGRASHARL